MKLKQRFGYTPKSGDFNKFQEGLERTIVFYTGEPCGGSFGGMSRGGMARGGEISRPLNLYWRNIPSLDDQLHVPPSSGFAKLKKSGILLSNYEAAMLDLRREKEGGESGGDSW